MNSKTADTVGLASRLEVLVRGLALPEGRRVGQPGHRVAEEWVAAQLRSRAIDCYRGVTALIGLKPTETCSRACK